MSSPLSSSPPPLRAGLWPRANQRGKRRIITQHARLATAKEQYDRN